MRIHLRLFLSIFMGLSFMPFQSQATPHKITRDELRALYPDLSDEGFATKLEGAEDPFHFFRTFVPLYYKMIHDEPTSEMTEALSISSGWCVGDAHPENFGVLVSDSGLAFFTMNDADDAGPCPLFADALRFFVALHLYDESFDLGDAIKAYSAGLNGSSLPFSKVTQESLKSSQGRLGPSKKDLDGTDHLKRRDMDREVTSEEHQALSDTLRARWGKQLLIQDLLATQKASGGSGGLRRYRVLVVIPSADGHRQQELLEFKQIQTPGISPLALGPIPPTAERLLRTLQLEHGANLSSLYATVRIGELEMLIRPRRAGNKGVSLGDLSQKDLKSVAQDEAFLLGTLHRQTASNLDGYRHQIEKLKAQQWHKMVAYCSDWMNETFTVLRVQ